MEIDEKVGWAGSRSQKRKQRCGLCTLSPVRETGEHHSILNFQQVIFFAKQNFSGRQAGGRQEDAAVVTD